MSTAALVRSIPVGRPVRAAGMIALFAGLYGWAFLLAVGNNDATAWWLTCLPAIAAGWTWGFRGGFLAGLAIFPLNVLLLSWGGLPGWALSVEMPGALAHAIGPLAGAVCGRLHELGLQLQAEREFRRETHRELQLTRRSLDATVRLLNDQATAAHHSQQAQSRAEAEVVRSKHELHKVNVRLTRSAMTDVLTELPNRRVALDRLHREWAAAQAMNRPLSCLVVRLDEPLKLRALHTQGAADQVLHETLDILRESIRRADEMFSLGGDEFLIVCPNADLSEAGECAERLRGLVEVNTVASGEDDCHVTVSIGVAGNCPGLFGAEDLLRASQQALYQAQHHGRNRVTCFDNQIAECGARAGALTLAM